MDHSIQDQAAHYQMDHSIQDQAAHYQSNMNRRMHVQLLKVFLGMLMVLLKQSGKRKMFVLFVVIMM